MMMHEEKIGQELLLWFAQEKRDLPWRNDKTPYKVWVSEVMLQQTQVEVVRPYFLKWMEVFPSVQALAQASFDDVVKLWEGLGYYSRAKNMHETAKLIVAKYQGEFPQDRKELLQMPGLGPYTVGAILSFAFGKKATAIDGNVMRVMTRLYGIESSIGETKTRKEIEQLLEKLLHEVQSPAAAMEGLIELGALVCQKKAKCFACPLQPYCRGYARALVDELPRRPRRVLSTSLHRFVFVIFSPQNKILVTPPKGSGLMGHLYEFPHTEEKIHPSQLIKTSLRSRMNLSPCRQQFTRYRVTLEPTIWDAEDEASYPNYHWIDIKEVKALPFSSGHRRILTQMQERGVIA